VKETGVQFYTCILNKIQRYSEYARQLRKLL